jgi:hypothetical protein
MAKIKETLYAAESAAVAVGVGIAPQALLVWYLSRILG